MNLALESIIVKPVSLVCVWYMQMYATIHKEEMVYFDDPLGFEWYPFRLDPLKLK